MRTQLMRTEEETALRGYYHALYRAWGPQHWWPAETQFEVIVGAYLTQNTAWANVEQALDNLRAAKALSLDGIRKMKLEKLERLIRPSGYFRQKANRIKIFIAYLDKNYDGLLDEFFAQPTSKLRDELLSLNGVGPETADSILLYAGNHPVFVVDAYTRRILDRHKVLPAKTDYEDFRGLLETALAPIVLGQTKKEQTTKEQTNNSADSPRLESGFKCAPHAPSAMSTATRTALVQVYNEMHGLIVGVGKHYCKKSKAACEGCPLQPFLP